MLSHARTAGMCLVAAATLAMVVAPVQGQNSRPARGDAAQREMEARTRAQDAEQARKARAEAEAEAEVLGEAVRAAGEAIRAAAGDDAMPDAADVAPAEGNLDDKDTDISFTFRPSSVSMNSSLNFDQEGKVTNTNSSMNIGLRVKYESKAQPVQIRNMQITKIITDTGERLTSQSQGSEQTLFSWENRNNNNSRSEFYMNFSLVPPARRAELITEISGTMEVVFAAGEIGQMVLEPFADYENKRITIKGLPGMFFKFSRENRNRGGDQQAIRVEMPRSLRPQIAGISFFDDLGRELTYNGWGGGSSNETEYRTLSVSLPDKGKIRVLLYPRMVTKTVPFIIKDLPIAPDNKVDAGDVMVELQPVRPIGGELEIKRLDPVVEQ